MYLLLCTVYFWAIQTIHCYKWLKKTKFNLWQNGTERNVLQQHFKRFTAFLRLQIQNTVKIKIIKIFCRQCIQFDWQLRENDLIILALPKPWTTGCADLIEAHCILNDENFICPAKQKTKIQQFVWRTMKQMITLVK